MAGNRPHLQGLGLVLITNRKPGREGPRNTHWGSEEQVENALRSESPHPNAQFTAKTTLLLRLESFLPFCPFQMLPGGDKIKVQFDTRQDPQATCLEKNLLLPGGRGRELRFPSLLTKLLLYLVVSEIKLWAVELWREILSTARRAPLQQRDMLAR